MGSCRNASNCAYIVHAVCFSVHSLTLYCAPILCLAYTNDQKPSVTPTNDSRHVKTNAAAIRPWYLVRFENWEKVTRMDTFVRPTNLLPIHPRLIFDSIARKLHTSLHALYIRPLINHSYAYASPQRHYFYSHNAYRSHHTRGEDWGA